MVRPMRPGHLLGGAPGLDEPVPAVLELVDGQVHPGGRPREQPDVLQDDEGRDGHGPEGGPGLGDGRWAREPPGPPTPRPDEPSSPPVVTATRLAPALAASPAASTVSSVSPENEMANTSDPRPTKSGRS